MPKQTDLFEKTFDQQVAATGGKLTGRDISPNILVRGELVFEPVSSGVRVTARDEQHRMLWGFIASQGMLAQMHCPVAVYDTLRDLLSVELKKRGLTVQEEQEAVPSALAALDGLAKTIQELRDSITVKKESSATRQRALCIKRLANDAVRSISLEAGSL